MEQTYAYQISTNGGRTFRTIAVGLSTEDVVRMEARIQRSGIIGQRQAQRDRDYRFTPEVNK